MSSFRRRMSSSSGQEPLIYVTTQPNQQVKLINEGDYCTSIIADGIKVPLASGIINYTFVNPGEHKVYIKFNPNVTGFDFCFVNCTNLTSIPENLFAKNRNATSFNTCFYNCNITSIPENLFIHNPNVTTFYRCFLNCNNIVSIPENLFSNNPIVNDFKECFSDCNFTTIPENIFANNHIVTSFDGCFRSSNLVSIPKNLFANNSNVTDFSWCFYHSRISSVPKNLFSNNIIVTNFKKCFGNCISLYGTTPNGKDKLGNTYELWERAGKPGYPPSINGDSCFYSCGSLSNYKSIPDDWK